MPINHRKTLFQLVLSFLLLLLLSLFPISSLSIAPQAIDENPVSTIYYEKPSAARFAASVFKHQQKGCLYNNQKYINGEEVQTDQPCLTCTCKQSVLLCALRVCPPVTYANISFQASQCQIVRKPNACCPTLECITIPQNEFNEFNGNENEIASNGKGGSTRHSTVTPLIAVDNLMLETISKEEHIDKPELTVIKHNHLLSVTHLIDRNTTILQTVPSSSYLDKTNNSLMITKPNHSKESIESYLKDLQRKTDKHCFVNGTFYAEGSAIVASSFCEYCYCIRSKRMCIRPRCHLSILGCLPRYSSEYACCPTSYACGEDALVTSNMTTDGKWPLAYTSNDQLFVNDQKQVNGNIGRKQESDLTILPTESTINTDMTTAATETVTELQFTTTSEPANSYTPGTRMSDCILDGYSYKVGELMPSNANCTQCYCSNGGIRSCKKIQCSLYLEHDCAPVIPEGHCCPVEYKCTPLRDNESLNVSTKIDDQYQNILTNQLENSTNLVTANFSTKENPNNFVSASDNETATTSANIVEMLTLTNGTVGKESDPIYSGSWSDDNNSNLDYNDNDNLVMSNSHRKISTKLDKSNITANESQFNNTTNHNSANLKRHILQDNEPEGRNIPDEPESEQTVPINGATDNGQHSNNSNKNTVPAIKFKNVAHFLNNFFHIFGITESSSNVNNHSQQTSNDAGGLTSLVADRIEITTTVQPSILSANKQNRYNEEKTAKLLDKPNQQVQPMPNVTNLASRQDKLKHGDLVKSMRDVQLQNTNVYFQHKPTYPNNNPGTKPQVLFSNGWKVVGPLKIRRPSLKPLLRNNSINVSAQNSDSALNESVLETTTTTTSQMEYIPGNGSSFESQHSNQSLLNSDLTKVRCNYNGQQYDSGAIINKSNDPCEYCRCFYGNEICQRHKCPLPPSSECMAENVPNQCCPLYICKMGTNSTNESPIDKEVKSSDHNNLISGINQDKSPIRSAPQFEQEARDPELKAISKKQDDPKIQKLESNVAVLMHSAPPPRISFPFNPLAPPIDFAYISRQENRIHFPSQQRHPNLQNSEMQPATSNANGFNKLPVTLNGIVKLDPFINRPLLFPIGSQYGGQIKLNMNKNDNQNTNFVNQSQIRRQPQFAVAVESVQIANQIPLPESVRPISMNANQSNDGVHTPAISTMSAVPSTTTDSPVIVLTSTVSSEPWNILKLSGCNIYGHMYKTNEEIEELGSKCKKCICSSQGVQCNEIC